MRSAAAVGFAALLVLATASCTLPGSDTGGAPLASDPPATAPPSGSATDPASSGTSAPASATPSPSAGPPTPADPAQPSTADQLGEVVATRSSSDQGRELTAKLYPVLRDGATSHVNLALSSSIRDPESFRIGTLLSDSNPSVSDETGFAADGLQLVDGKNAKVHLVASDGQGQCLCSRGLVGVQISDDAPVLISATFGSPPADVTQVDVRIPGFGTVKNVPVQ